MNCKQRLEDYLRENARQILGGECDTTAPDKLSPYQVYPAL